MTSVRVYQVRNLRQRAEARIQAENVDLSIPSAEEALGLLEDLRLHQAELELQNEDLQVLQQQLERSREEYRTLFEFAPVGYFIINREALILKVNVTGANQLGVLPLALPQQPFTRYIDRESQDTFFRHRRQLLKTQQRCSCELQMVTAGGARFYAQLESLLLP